MKPDTSARPALEIEKYMSSVMLTVTPAQSIAEAIRLMRLHEIRHLPVVENGRVVGVLSQRDIYLLQSFDRAQPGSVPIEEVMTKQPFLVEPEAPVDLVAREMARRRIGSAIVARDRRLLGMFTTTDALLALAAVIEAQHSPELLTPALAKPASSNPAPAKPAPAKPAPAKPAPAKPRPAKPKPRAR